MASRKSKPGRPLSKRPLSQRPLGELIAAEPRLLELLDKHGITFCAGCYLTLFSPPLKAAVYHAVPDPQGFLRKLERLLSGRHGPTHSPIRPKRKRRA
ncbi:MAG: hypothetical protein KGO96_11155 [Elusimicrobia bacterium]|nr:hypothetical protein [Elusimicrobiota bacterium]MDE2237334.1 hypothetical protein [Elusimicrobiota bacterium]MDE2426450.1 hypothetical protein [Elusimicrobiota bacterium]